MDDIVVDIGGTQLRAAVYPPEGLQPRVIKKIATQGEEPAIDRLYSLINSIWHEAKGVRRIAIGAPGALNPVTGITYTIPNIPNWDGLHLKDLVEEKFNVEVRLGNDANLAALGEWKYGAGVGHHNLIYLTVSTGLGGGIIVDDRLLVGANGLAAEVGHITVLPGGPMCGCGFRGHLEAMSSGTGIANYVKRELGAGRTSILTQAPEPVTARTIAHAAALGDELSLEAFITGGTYLGRAIADLAHIFNPTIVILGGSVTNAGELLMKPVRSALEKTVISPMYLEDFILTTAKLGDRVGLVGALALARS
jgi:glucokinase